MRTLLAAVALTAVALSPAGARFERIEQVPYADPALGTAGFGICLQGDSCVFVEPEPGEAYASIEIDDDAGLPVYASVIQDTNGDGSYLATDDHTVHLCGATSAPLPIEEKTLTIWVWPGPGLDPPCAGTATSGTVTVTFSDVP